MTCVDVVIPCYNYAHFLPRCVESVLNQKGVKVRVLIIDDCSNDSSESVGLSLAAKDGRIEFRRHDKNCGHIATYNEGLLQWASSEYSLLLSADDMLAPGALLRAASLMDRYPEVGMTYGLACNIWDDETPALNAALVSEEYRIVSSSEFLTHCFKVGNGVPTPTAVVRTAVQHHLGGYRSDLPHSGDMEMWMRFAAHGPVGVLRALQAFYRKHSGNMSNQYYQRLLGDQQEVLQAAEQILEKWGSQYPESASWREMIQQQISQKAFWSASNNFDTGDVEGCRICLEFAEQIYPKIRGSKIWWKLQTKRLFGPALWQIFRPTWNRLRVKDKTCSEPETATPSPTTQLVGWWPEALP